MYKPSLDPYGSYGNEMLPPHKVRALMFCGVRFAAFGSANHLAGPVLLARGCRISMEVYVETSLGPFY